MVSSGIRVGAWDHLNWNHITPIIRNDKLVAAKINVYAGDDDEYITFITPEAYRSLGLWMKYRDSCREHVSKLEWITIFVWILIKLTFAAC